MNIIVDKQFGRSMIIDFFGKQSTKCDFCERKVTQKNLGMIFKCEWGNIHACCNSLICYFKAEKIRKMRS